MTFTLITFALCGWYGMVIFFRLFSVMLALIYSNEHRLKPDELAALKDDELPIYTILVPMYKEPEIAQKIARYMSTLDYPQEKLDVKLLLEEDDVETRAKIAEIQSSLPSCIEIVLAPIVGKGQPRTKPRACNWGLERARGKYLVIFDAEDRPEADQLKKAILAFRNLERSGKKHVVCLQAKLNYFNARQNSLTRFFTLEYTNWFDLFLPGLHAVRTPIPLGGTSNHFHTEVLQKMGGWDPFNVTEDCDLGIRLAHCGYTTEILDSTTWEEANCRTGNWIRQRSRWIKGYFQTHLVHSRDAFLPLFGIAALFLGMGVHYTTDTLEPLDPTVATCVRVLRNVNFVLGGIALLAGVYSLLRRVLRSRRLDLHGQPVGESLFAPWRALSFRLSVGGMSFMLLLNVIFWFVAALYLLRVPISESFIGDYRWGFGDYATSIRDNLKEWNLYYTNVTEEIFTGTTFWNTLSGWIHGSFTSEMAFKRFHAIDEWSLISQLFYPVAMMLFMANLIFVLLGLISCHKRKLWDLFPYALLMPFYWILVSIAAIKGFLQFFSNPWYWEKTTHGHTATEPPLIAVTPPVSPVPPAAVIDAKIEELEEVEEIKDVNDEDERPPVEGEPR